MGTLTNISWRKQEILIIKYMYRQLLCFINIKMYPGCPFIFVLTWDILYDVLYGGVSVMSV